MCDAKIFGERIFQLRRKAGLNQKQLGDAVGLSHKAISTIEGGSRGTSVDKLAAFSYYFHVSTDYLLGITDDPAWRGAEVAGQSVPPGTGKGI